MKSCIYICVHNDCVDGTSTSENAGAKATASTAAHWWQHADINDDRIAPKCECKISSSKLHAQGVAKLLSGYTTA